MGLKYRYAAFLLAVFTVICIFCFASVYLLLKAQYFATVCILGFLYISTFLLGKKFSKIFFVLSFLRLLRKNNGVMLLDSCEAFIRDSIGSRKSYDEILDLQHEILDKLQKEKIINISGDTILLL